MTTNHPSVCQSKTRKERRNVTENACSTSRDPGSIRIYFTVEDVRQKLRKGKQRSVAVLRELEASGLIRRRKRGQGRPAIITLYYPDSVRFVERKGEAHDL